MIIGYHLVEPMKQSAEGTGNHPDNQNDAIASECCNTTKLTSTSKQEKCPEIQYLHQWMKKQGFMVHPALKIPQDFDGIQGIGSSQMIPHKTVVLAVPSHTILTVTKCYEDPVLKPLFQSNDDLFDYEADEEAQFKILCVYLMYHKLHIQQSPYKAYLQTISLPQTAVDWPDSQLAGLNKSLVEEILHVRRQCTKVEEEICQFLLTHKYFKHLSQSQIVDLFRLCYKSVLTRCFGYYFSTACLIPVADLMNHHCESIDHQLVHLDYERGQGFDPKYKPRKEKLNCQLMGLSAPTKKISLPFQLEYLVKNGIVERDPAILANLRVKDINNCIDGHLSKQMNCNKLPQSKDGLDLQDLDFCELDDEEDNDTEEDTEYNQSKTLQRMIKQEKQQMQQFQQHYVQVQAYQDVQKQVGQSVSSQKKVKHDNQHIQSQSSDPRQDEQRKKEKPVTSENQSGTLGAEETDSKLEEGVTDNKAACSDSKNVNHEVNVPQNICPVEMVASSSESSNSSEQEEWCLDPSCYFTMSTTSPVSAGSQLYTSYGSRTNKFLLVWYGFAYRDNLYDSVTLRMQALFSPVLPEAKSIVLDTYIGGQGLCFKKNETEQVKPEQVSREFRLKRSNLSKGLIMYLRLFLLNYYKGEDLYKIFVTFPSSIEFELFMFRYYRDVVQSLYERFPTTVVEGLYREFEHATNSMAKKRMQFKIIYIEEQLKILDTNLKAVEAVIGILQRIKARPGHQFDSSVYGDVDMSILRVAKDYLISLKQNQTYLCYAQGGSIPQAIITQGKGSQVKQSEDEQDYNETKETK